MNDILERILARKREEIAELKRRHSAAHRDAFTKLRVRQIERPVGTPLENIGDKSSQRPLGTYLGVHGARGLPSCGGHSERWRARISGVVCTWSGGRFVRVLVRE